MAYVARNRSCYPRRRVRCGRSIQSLTSLKYWIVRSSAQLRTRWIMTIEHVFAFSRRIASEVCRSFAHERRGRRECRVHAAPAVSCARSTWKCAHEHTGSAETLRHSLRNGFTAYAVLSSATNSSCHRRRRIQTGLARLGRRVSADLASATDARTTRFCRTQPAPFVLRASSRSQDKPALRSPCAPTLSRPPHPIPRS